MKRRFPRWFQGTAPVSTALAAVNVSLWLLQQAVDGTGGGPMLGLGGLWPAAVLEHGALWQLVTHMFLHGPWWHILMNALCLLSLGPPLERTMGRVHYLVLYFFSGMAGGCAHVAAYAGQGYPAVGASGAIMGVFAALVALHRRSRFVIILLPFWSIPGGLLFGVVLVLHAAWVLFGWNAAGMALEIHLAGLVAGWAYATFAFRPLMRSRNDALRPAAPSAAPSAPPPAAMDDLLDKVAREGIQSLTREERARLGRE